MIFAVLCNNHTHRLQVLDKFYTDFPESKINRITNEILIGDNRFYLIRKEDINQILGVHINAVIFPPGYHVDIPFEHQALTRIR